MPNNIIFSDDEALGYVQLLENPNKVGWDKKNKVWRTPKQKGYDSNQIAYGLDIREENNPIVYNYLKSKGRLNDPWLTDREAKNLMALTWDTKKSTMSKIIEKTGGNMSQRGYNVAAGMIWHGHPAKMMLNPDSVTGKAFTKAVASGDRDLNSVFDAYYGYGSNATQFADRIRLDRPFRGDILEFRTGDGNKILKFRVNKQEPYESTWKPEQPTKTIYPLSGLTEIPLSLSSWKGASAPNITPRLKDFLEVHQEDLNRGVNIFGDPLSPFSLRLKPPSLTSLLLLNSPEELAKQYFADVLGISDMMPEMPSLFPRLKNGKLPRFGDGTRLVVGDDGWNRITDSDVANLMENWVATPYGIRNKFDYEYNPNYKQPIGKNAAVRQDNNAWTRQRVAEESNKRSWLSDAADVSHAIGEGAMLASTFAAPEVEPLVYPAYLATKNAVLSALTSNTPVMLYVRYPLGKVIYGMDALFPTLYRKIKSMPTEPVNGTIQISNPGNRFVFSNTKKESPIITNFTYDAPVRKHARGNWDSGFTLAMPGRKTLLGKNVISTEPSDLFTYGDDIKIPLKDVTLISGDLDEIALANKYGYKVATSPKLLQLYLEGDSPGILFTSNGGRKLSLRKQELSAYAKEIENTTRLLFRSPTKNDVDFMNFVLLPKIKGNVYDPSMLDYLINNGIGTFGDRIGNAELRSYLLDPDRWRNILYDPATHAESLFRNLMGIDLKRGYKDGKSPIHIKPANKGKLTRLKKRTGKSESELYNDGNPAHRKMVVFARNARKWKH